MLTLVTGYSKNLSKLFNEVMPWNYAIYSRKRNMKPVVRATSPIRISSQLKTTNCEIATALNRSQDPYFLIRKVYEKLINGNEGYDLMIPDFRFPEEYEFLNKKGKKMQTIRVFESLKIVDVESKNMFQTEHELHDFETDFLFIPENNHKKRFLEALTIFPQYKNFKYLSYKPFDNFKNQY